MSLSNETIHKAQKDWASAVIAQDANALAALYSREAVLKPTLSAAIRRSPDDIEAYFIGGDKYDDNGFLKNGFKEVNFTETSPMIKGDFAIDTGIYEFVKPDGSKTEAHFTFFYELVDGELKIVTQHSSLK